MVFYQINYIQCIGYIEVCLFKHVLVITKYVNINKITLHNILPTHIYSSHQRSYLTNKLFILLYTHSVASYVIFNTCETKRADDNIQLILVNRGFEITEVTFQHKQSKPILINRTTTVHCIGQQSFSQVCVIIHDVPIIILGCGFQGCFGSQ